METVKPKLRLNPVILSRSTAGAFEESIVKALAELRSRLDGAQETKPLPRGVSLREDRMRLSRSFSGTPRELVLASKLLKEMKRSKRENPQANSGHPRAF